MLNITKYVFFIICIFISELVQADFLYWQLDFTDNGAYECPWKVSDGEAPYAWMVAINNTTGERYTLSGIDEYQQESKYVKLDQIRDDETVYSLSMSITIDTLTELGVGANEYSFFVELGNYMNNTENALYESVRVSYNNLKSTGRISEYESFEKWQVWNPALDGFTRVIPEPDSFMLFLFGICILLLKRNK